MVTGSSDGKSWCTVSKSPVCDEDVDIESIITVIRYFLFSVSVAIVKTFLKHHILYITILIIIYNNYSFLKTLLIINNIG